jgi:hypothetical protein
MSRRRDLIFLYRRADCIINTKILFSRFDADEPCEQGFDLHRNCSGTGGRPDLLPDFGETFLRNINDN